MVSLTCTVDRRDGVTLVSARLEGTGVPQRVRLANRLDGPVWPPRRQGVPEAGWDGDGFETVVPAGASVAVGYASPAPPDESPLAVVDRAVVDDHGDDGAVREASVTPDEALRQLGDPSPPRDAVPIPAEPSVEPAPDVDGADGDRLDDSGVNDDACAEEETDGTANDGAATEVVVDRPRDGDAEREPAPDAEPDTGPEPEPAQRPDAEIPAAVAAWLDDVEGRVELAERLAAVETLPEATAAVGAAGCLEDAERVIEGLQRDAGALAAVARRADRLADRSDAADVPLATLKRLA